MFSKLRNQLRGVTLNNKVKLKLGLISSRTQLKTCARASEDDGYVLDADGNRILIGLTLDETREFERLDQLLLSLSPVSTGLVRETNCDGLCFMTGTRLRCAVI